MSVIELFTNKKTFGLAHVQLAHLRTRPSWVGTEVILRNDRISIRTPNKTFPGLPGRLCMVFDTASR